MLEALVAGAAGPLQPANWKPVLAVAVIGTAVPES